MHLESVTRARIMTPSEYIESSVPKRNFSSRMPPCRECRERRKRTRNDYEVRFDLTDTLFCLTKYELVRTTKFTRLVLPLLYVPVSIVPIIIYLTCMSNSATAVF